MLKQFQLFSYGTCLVFYNKLDDFDTPMAVTTSEVLIDIDYPVFILLTIFHFLKYEI